MATYIFLDDNNKLVQQSSIAANNIEEYSIGSGVTIQNAEFKDNAINVLSTDSSGKIKITRTNTIIGGYMDIGMTYDDGGSRGATGMINVIKNSTNTVAPNFSLYLQSSEKLTVLSNGNTGIGTTAPNEKLQVNGNILSTGNISAAKDTESTSHFGYAAIGRASDSDNHVAFAFTSCANKHDYALQQASSGHTMLNCKSDKDIQFRSNNTTKITMLSNGYLGIGTSTPERAIHIKGESGDQLSNILMIEGDNWDPLLTFRRDNLDTHIYKDMTNNTLKITGRIIVAGDGVSKAAEFDTLGVGTMGHPGYAGVSHISCSDTTNYALLQDSLGETAINSASNCSIHFRSANINLMSMLSSGNFGIGTANPARGLHISGNSNDRTRMRITSTTSDKNPVIEFQSSDLGLIYLYKLGSHNKLTLSGGFDCSELITADNHASFKRTSPYTYFYAPGGTNSAVNHSGSYYSYHDNGSVIYFNTPGGGTGGGTLFSFATGGTRKANIRMDGYALITGSWLDNSNPCDGRLKINQKLYDKNATDIINKIQIKSYDKYRLDNFDTKVNEETAEEELLPFMKRLGKTDYDIGVIAQEFINIPELAFMVDTNDWSDTEPAFIKTIRPLVFLLVKSNQEQQKEINTLKEENNTLKTENATLKEIIDKLTSATSFEDFKNSL
jgi:hypothetical protein